MEKIVIIGAGPAGLLLAHYLLARHRYRVEIYERRPDPRLATIHSQRTFPISLQGQNALRGDPFARCLSITDPLPNPAQG